MDCGHIHPNPDQWGEFICDITGNPVEQDCPDLTADACMPRKALMLRAQTLPVQTDSRTQEVIAMVAEGISHNGGADDLGRKSVGELEQLIAAARAQIVAKKRAVAGLPRLHKRMERLRTQHKALTAEIEELSAQIQAVEEGRIEAAAVVTKKPRTHKWTPEQRAAQAEVERLRGQVGKLKSLCLEMASEENWESDQVYIERKIDRIMEGAA